MNDTCTQSRSFVSRHLAPLRGERGFTLVEVLITAAILAIGLLGSAGMVISSISGNDRGKDLTIAVGLADDKVEEIREQIKTWDGVVAVVQTYLNGVQDPDPIPGYRRYAIVRWNTPEQNMLTVTVSIRWQKAVETGTDRTYAKGYLTTTVLSVPANVKL